MLNNRQLLLATILHAAIETKQALGVQAEPAAYRKRMEAALRSAGVAFASASFSRPPCECLLCEGDVLVCLETETESEQPLEAETFRENLRQQGCAVGFLIDFTKPLLLDGIRRVAAEPA